jgi:hypothetical protein
MPVSLRAADLAEVDIADVGVKHEVADASTRLPWLGDVIPVPVLSTLLSAGDLLIAAGIAWLVYRSTVAGPEPRVVSEPGASG